MEYKNKPLLFVVFGITGDLAHRKILPALYHLIEHGDMPENFTVIGVTRQSYSTEQLYEGMADHLGKKYDAAILERLRAATAIAMLDIENIRSYESLLQTIEAASMTLGKNVTRMYYLSIPAQAFTNVITQLGSSGHGRPFPNESSPPRLLIEKPFGYDLSSAKLLINAAEAYFNEDQLYRIDHYLAKETAQNILTFRFNNPLFKAIWNSHHIHRISIVAHETIGIEGRANFYEHTGALRDIIQSHLLQLLALTTMAPPDTFDSSGIRLAKWKLLGSITPIESANVRKLAVRGQYKGYREEVANSSSSTETFARLQLAIDNEQWRGVAIELEAGKALSERKSEITIYFRCAEGETKSNRLIFRVQPREGITLTLDAKKPGLNNETQVVDMTFDYASSFGMGTADAYERVIVDAIRGDQSLFLSSEEVLRCWEVVENVLEEWKNVADDLVLYEKGSTPSDIQPIGDL